MARKGKLKGKIKRTIKSVKTRVKGMTRRRYSFRSRRRGSGGFGLGGMLRPALFGLGGAVLAEKMGQSPLIGGLIGGFLGGKVKGALIGGALGYTGISSKVAQMVPSIGSTGASGIVLN